MRNIFLFFSAFLIFLSVCSPADARRSRRSRSKQEHRVAAVPAVNPALQARLDKLNAEYKSQVTNKEAKLLKKKAKLEVKSDSNFFAKKYKEAKLGFVKMELDQLDAKKTVYKKRYADLRAEYK